MSRASVVLRKHAPITAVEKLSHIRLHLDDFLDILTLKNTSLDPVDALEHERLHVIVDC